MKKTLLAVAAVCAMTSTAHAAAINATGAVALIGVSALPPATVIDIGSIFSFVSSVWSSGTGDLDASVVGAPALGSALTTATVTASLGSTASFTAGWGSFNGLITNVQSVEDRNNRTVSFYAVGDFVPNYGGFTSGPMSMTFSATQTGGRNASISASYTIASPPAGVPEPTTLALVGLAVAGVGFAYSRRRSA